MNLVIHSWNFNGVEVYKWIRNFIPHRQEWNKHSIAHICIKIPLMRLQIVDMTLTFPEDGCNNAHFSLYKQDDVAVSLWG